MLDFTRQLQIGLRSFLKLTEARDLAHLVAELFNLGSQSTVVEPKFLHLALQIEELRLPSDTAKRLSHLLQVQSFRKTASPVRITVLVHLPRQTPASVSGDLRAA